MDSSLLTPMPQLAEVFSLSAAEVQGVISFYHDFRDQPASSRAVQICCAEACQAVGSRELESQAPQALGVEFGETHPRALSDWSAFTA